jgi:hypothetical protein
MYRSECSTRPSRLYTPIKPTYYILKYLLNPYYTQLLDTQFASTLDPRLLDQLRTSNSVPLFLATVTQEMFEAQTFMG